MKEGAICSAHQLAGSLDVGAPDPAQTRHFYIEQRALSDKSIHCFDRITPLERNSACCCMPNQAIYDAPT
jgi:hypothetical protein